MKVSKVLQLLETDISLKEPHVSRTPDRAQTTQGCCIPASGTCGIRAMWGWRAFVFISLSP